MTSPEEMLSVDNDYDCDVVYVDFDELFHGDELASQDLRGHIDDGHLIAHYLSDNNSTSESEMVQSYKKGPNRTGPKPMTKEQFYKIRPKMPRINKTDIRRNYAAAYADAYNSCDFDVIYDFLSDYCVPDVLFIQKWVGSDQYLNFPQNLEFKGIDAAAEYWFSRCLLAPDLALQLKVTKLFVRSDGFSSIASSFTILCTRLFDGELSDSLIRTVAADDSTKTSTPRSSSASTGPAGGTFEEDNASALSANSSDDKLDTICNRAIEKVEKVLLQSTPKHDPVFSLNRKRKHRDSIDSDGDSLLQSSESHGSKRRMPKDKTITLLGNVTMSLNEDKKIYRLEVSFALKQD